MKKIITKIVYSLLLTLFLTTSCSIQKRRYTNGFYTYRNSSTQNQIHQKLKHESINKVSEEIQREYLPENKHLDYSASLNSDLGLIFAGKKPIIKYTDLNDTCDILVLKTGDEIRVKVTEILPEMIKYMRCDFLDGPIISIAKKDVFMIQYANGKKEVIVSDESANKNQSNNTNPSFRAEQNEKKIQGLGIVGLISSIIGLFVGGIILGTLGVVFGIVSLNKINKYPEKFKNKKGFAIWSIVIGIIAIIGAIIAIALLV